VEAVELDAAALVYLLALFFADFEVVVGVLVYLVD